MRETKKTKEERESREERQRSGKEEQNTERANSTYSWVIEYLILCPFSYLITHKFIGDVSVCLSISFFVLVPRPTFLAPENV